MPTITKLTGHTVMVQPVVAPTADGEGMERRWAFAAKCKVTGNEVWVEFSEEVKDMIVKTMTGGIVLPDGSTSIENFRADEG